MPCFPGPWRTRKTTRYEIEEWQLEGQIVQQREPGVVFATTGDASQNIRFPDTGRYLIGVRARGTPSDGIFPLVRVSIDGTTVGTVGTTDQWQTTAVEAGLVAGTHRVSVAFINDGSNPPKKDRNLYVDRIEIAMDTPEDGLTLLTAPAALAVARCGKGHVVFDQIDWTTEQANSRKAMRFAGSLLTALGGEAERHAGTMIEAEIMTPQENMPYFSNSGSFATLACNGYIATPLRVVRAGHYVAEIVAAGTAVENVYPQVELLIDGHSAGSVQLVTSGWRGYKLPLDLPAGDHELRLAFTNDLNRGGEDRNLQLDKVSIYRGRCDRRPLFHGCRGLLVAFTGDCCVAHDRQENGPTKISPAAPIFLSADFLVSHPTIDVSE